MNETVVRTALRRATEGIGPYPVLGPALRQAARRRFARWVAAPVAVVLLAASALAGWVAVTGEPAERTGKPTEPLAGLPNGLHDPRSGTPTVSDQPPGPVAVAYTGVNYNRPLSDALYVVLSGPAGYRVTDRWDRDEVHPGEEVLLSPAGDRLASYEMEDEAIAVLDLRTGKRQTVRKPSGSAVLPLAWSPDNRTLAVAVNPDHRSGYAIGWREIGLLDTGTGMYRRIATPDGTFAWGFAAAFSRDGQRLAYQSDDRIRVVALDGTASADFPVPTNSRLAGKGAFTPDGAFVAVSVSEGCCTHRFAFYEVATGAEHSGRRSAAIADTVALRLLGWSPQGRAVAVAFRPEPGARPTEAGGRTRYQVVRRADIVSVGSGNVLINTTSNVLAVDLAEQAIATGRIVPAPPKPPGLILPFTLPLRVVVIPALVVVLVVLLVLLYRRRRRA